MQPGPDGWHDDAKEWQGADGLWKRLEWAVGAAEDVATVQKNPVQLAKDVVGPSISSETLFEVGGADSPAQGLAILAVSKEFLRR